MSLVQLNFETNEGHQALRLDVVLASIATSYSRGQLQQWIKKKNGNGEIPFLSSEVGKGFTRKEQTQKLMEFFETCLKNPVST